MARTKAHRKYQLTINNPEEHGFTHDVLKTTLETFKGLLYWCMADETGGETGTYHTHVYFAAQNPIEFQTVQQRFYGVHIEAARGTHQQNRDYIRKEGNWETDVKHGTRVEGTFEECGELPPEENRRLKTSEAIFEMVQEGKTNAEILKEYPSSMNHLRNIYLARQTLREEEYREKFRELQVTYVWGKTGVGKTRGIMEKYGYRNVFQVTNYQRYPFDGYAGEDVILFDEFRSSLPIADMLKYLDGYPLRLPCRYGDKVACFTKVYVVINIPMEKQYPNIQVDKPETWNAFLRRFKGNITEMLPPKQDIPDWALF